MYVYSLSTRLVWQDKSALALLPLLEVDWASLTGAPLGSLFGGMLQRVGLLSYDISLRYAEGSAVEGVSWLGAPLVGKDGLPSSEPYRYPPTDGYRVLDLLIAGSAPLYALGYFSVGASKPHSRSKIALLFQELRPLVSREFRWRMSPQKEQQPLSLEEVTSLGLCVVG